MKYVGVDEEVAACEDTEVAIEIVAIDFLLGVVGIDKPLDWLLLLAFDDERRRNVPLPPLEIMLPLSSFGCMTSEFVMPINSDVVIVCIFAPTVVVLIVDGNVVDLITLCFLLPDM